jgi:pyruvate/2-oxoglutarate dehydrogenase complex dihydrolipoamide dehydrogenase (E3) component
VDRRHIGKQQSTGAGHDRSREDCQLDDTDPATGTPGAVSSTGEDDVDIYDLVVIGGGSAGLTGARLAGRLGARTLLAEGGRLGGDCLWTGCVPSKALLHVAAQVRAARDAGRYGMTAADGPVDLGQAMAAVRRAIGIIEPHDSVRALGACGVEVAAGQAQFIGPRIMEVAGREVGFRYALIATGSAPALPPVPGLAQAAGSGLLLTSDTVWDLEKLPGRLVVLGGGPAGCELGQAFARLGSRVTIIEAAGRLLPREEESASELVRRHLSGEGVTVLAGTPAGRVEDGVLHAGEHEIAYDRLLVTTGRMPRTAGMGLEAAGVATDDAGHVTVDARLRTANPRVYAAGDVTRLSAFTHLAGVQAASAVLHALLGTGRRVGYAAVPWVTFTDPEVARVGLTYSEARRQYGGRAREQTLGHDRVDRAVAEDRADGFTRLVFGPHGRLAGATVVAPRAGETIAELATAVRTGATAGDLAATVHPYPTYADGPWLAALAEGDRRLAAPGMRRLVNVLAGARRTIWR